MSRIKLQKRHFEFIAELLNASVNAASDEHGGELRRIVIRFADALEKTNPNFDRARFLIASLSHLKD